MATSHSITRTYQTQDLTVEVPFRKDGFFNATAVAKAFGKEPYEWLRLPATVEYTAQLVDSIQRGDFPGFKENQLVITKKGAPETGGGTWLHPKLGVPFARWLDVKFAVWCDAQIDAILRGETPTLQPRRGDITALTYAMRVLNMSPSSQVQVLTKYFEQFTTTRNLMPVYAIDAPIIAGTTGESSEATAAATTLLSELHAPFGAKTFLELAENEGYVVHLSRPSTVDPTKEKKFWSITEKGLAYGKNLVNPNNPRETQPHWYRNRFKDLLNQMLPVEAMVQ
jgi:hypothetical protein